MNRNWYIAAVIILLSCAACSQEKTGENKTTGQKAPKLDKEKLQKARYHGDMKTVTAPDQSAAIIDTLKQNKLMSIDSTKTIGQAFDGYRQAKKKEWRGTLGANNVYYTDFICHFDVSPFSAANIREDIVSYRLEIKFASHKDGETNVATVSRFDLKKDGTMNTVHYPPEERERIVRAIYGNKEAF